MAIPSGVTTRVVRGTYVNGAGIAQQGSVTFRIDQPLLATVESWGVIPSPTVAQLDSNGSFNVTLMASDDEGLFPSGFMWLVQERFQGGYLRTYRIDLAPNAEPLNLPDASQYDPGDVGLGVVHSVNGLTGNVRLFAQDYGGLPLTGGTLTGPLTLVGDPTGNLQPATKQYADTKMAKSANLSDLGNVNAAKFNLGISNVNNTSDAGKPISTATQTALDTKLTKSSNLLDLPNIPLARNNLGLGNVDNTTDLNKPISTATQTALDTKLTKSANLSDLTNATTARTNIGLGNVDNTSDTNKPISTATQTSLDTKLVKTANLSDLTNVPTARTNLGLGNVAVLNIGTTAGTVAAGNDARLTDQRTPLDNSVTSTKIVDGTIVNADINASAAIALSKLAVDPLARANHTGTQLSSTISDFSTSVASTAALKANNLSDLASIPTSRTNLGLGDSAVLNVGTTASTVAAGDDARLTDQRTPIDNSVTAAKIATDAVITVKIQDSAVTTPKIANLAVDVTKIADGAVTSAKILDGTIVNADINASAAIALSKLAVDPLARANHTGTQTAATVSDFNTVVRTNRLDQMAAPSVAVPWGSQRITTLADPTGAQDAATKAYVDAQAVWLDVRDFNTVGDDIADDTAAIQAAINALPATGGILWFPAGVYRIATALTLKSNITLMGVGQVASIIHQTSSSANALTGVDVFNVAIQDLQLQGPAAGTGNGLAFTRSVQDNVRYLTLQNVYIRQFGNDGIAVSNCIVSQFTRVISENNGRFGFYFYGVVSGAAGTSVGFDACYANTNTNTGFNLYNMAYSSINACASEGQPINYLLDNCQGVAIMGSGSEIMTSGGVGFKVNGGIGNTLISCWDLTNRGIAFWITGSPSSINLIGLVENSPGAGATASLKVDVGSVGINLHGITNTTALSLSPATTNILNDGANGMTIHGYFYTDGAAEFNNSVIFDQVATHYGDMKAVANTQIGGATMTVGGGYGVMGVTNAAIVPTTNPTGGVVVYSEAGVLKWRSPAGTVYDLSATGGGGGVSTAGGSTITASGPTVIPLIFKAAASQTADILQVQDSTAAVKTRIKADGTLEHSGNLAVNLSTQVGGLTTTFGSGVGVLGLTNATTLPTTNPTGGLVLYSEAGVLKVRDPNGVITLLTNPVVPPVYRIGRQPTGTVLTNMQTGHGWTQTGTGTAGLNDTTDFLSGSQSAWVQSGGGGVQCNLRKYASALGDTTGKALRFRVKVDDLTHLSELTLIVGKNTIADSYKFSWQVNGNAFLTSGDWCTVTLSWANATVDSGTPLRTDPTDVAFQVFDDNTTNAVKMHVQSLEVIPGGMTAFPNGLISICFDDAFAGPKTLGYAKLDSYGYPATNFIIQDYLGTGGRLTVQDLKNRCDRYGWEIASHASLGANHALSQTGMTAAQLDADLRVQRGVLEGIGFRGASGYAYPLGQFGKTTDAASTIDITRKYFSYARTTHNRTTETLPPADPYRLRAISSISSFAGGNSIASLTTTTTGKIDKAKAEGAWLILVFHDITSGAATNTTECAQTDFNTVIDKINSAGMPVLTIEDALKQIYA